MEIQRTIILIGLFSPCSAAPNEFVKFACRFFDGMFDECPKVCNQYILPPNAIWVNGNHKDSSEFTCTKGYTLVGNTNCDNGNWNLQPTCQAVKCPSGEKIANSDNVTQSGTIGKEFGFSCLKGYTGNGSTGTMVCDEDGDWTMKVTCKDIDDCVDHPCGDYGQCTDKVNGYECRCSPGFNGTNCEIDEDDCINNPCGDTGQCIDVINGFYCKCNFGFTGELCDESQCMSDPVILNGTINTNITSRDIGQQYDFTCQEPFTDIGTEGVVTCNANGEWEANITCKGQCMSDPVISNGTINTNITSRDIGQKYDFTCQEPYTDIGTEGVVTCNVNGEWEANITCKDCIKILEKRFIYIDAYKIRLRGMFSESECNDKCEETQCGYIRYTSTNCELYRRPLIFVEFSSPSQVQCVRKCKEFNGCITMSYDPNFNVCMLMNATLEELPFGNLFFGNGAIIQDTC